MGKKKVRYSDEYKACEAFFVLIRRERASRSITKLELRSSLAAQGVYSELLKICLEQDGIVAGGATRTFKKGIYLVLQSIGLGIVEKEVGISRVTLYRMFAPSGNPTFSHFLKVLYFLKLRLWTVDEDFLKRGQRTRRLKDEMPSDDAYLDKRFRISRGRRRKATPDYDQ